MTRELSDVLIVLVAIGLPTLAILFAVLLPKVQRERARSARENRALRAENRLLKAELARVGARVADVERIVTDDSHRLTRDIESLRVTRN